MNIAAETLIDETIRLAAESVMHGGGPFAALIIKEGTVISTGINSVTIDNDPTAHAEINAIRAAALKLNTFDLSGCEIYSSCEPCPMCLGAIYWARMERIFFAANRDAASDAGFDDSLIYGQINLLPEKRSIPAWLVARPDALIPFVKWKEIENKIKY